MLRYVYTNISNIFFLAEKSPDRFHDLLVKTKYLIHTKGSNASTINGLRNLHLINFNGKISDYQVTNLDVHTICKVVEFGLHTAQSFISYVNNGQIDLVEQRDIKYNYLMYNEIVLMKGLEVNHPNEYQQRLPEYHKKLLDFYSKGYDFTK